MSDILVIGCRGFIGRAIVQGLRQRGHSVYGTVYSGQPGTDEYPLDIRKRDSFNALPRRFDIIINASGSVDNQLSGREIFALNSQGAKNICDWAADNDCQHFIQVSSTAAYGGHSIGENRIESSHPIWAYIGVDYQRSKASAERYIRRQGIPYTLLRMPAVFGAGDSFVSPVISDSLINNSYFSCGNADKKISLIAVDCLGDILDRVVRKTASNEIFNCASHHIIWRELVAEYAQALKLPVPARKKPLVSLPFKLTDMHHLFLLTTSRFGAHFPTDKFRSYYGDIRSGDWKEIVQRAAEQHLQSRAETIETARC